jgi:arylsulfatase A-like enzyme
MIHRRRGFNPTILRATGLSEIEARRGIDNSRAMSRLLLGVVFSICVLSACVGRNATPTVTRVASPPNIIFVLADDLGYGELGAFGQKLIATPRLDEMAQQGLRFSQFYAGNTVCAPSRAVLMTGKHMGHVSVRGNASKAIQHLLPQDRTVAQVLKDAGYKTALIGKWGLGEEGSGALPDEKGFDFFYGYLNQTHAHNGFPEFIWRNRSKASLQNVVTKVEPYYGDFVGGYATKKVQWTEDLFLNEAETWIRQNSKQPFFLYLSLVIPHANNEATAALGDGQEIPDYGRYADRPWSNSAKGQAALVSRLDQDVGRVLDVLRKLSLAENTLVVFSSDNGPHAEGGFDTDSFRPSGPLRGMKRDLYEGGIRVPTIAWWPGVIKPGRISRHMGYFGDILATFADIAGAQPPAGLDSLSFAAELRGYTQMSHKHLYFEFVEQGGKQAVRKGRWKAVRHGLGSGHVELYDLDADLGEAHDLASAHPEVVADLTAIMAHEHVADQRWSPRGSPVKLPPPGDGIAPF